MLLGIDITYIISFFKGIADILGKRGLAKLSVSKLGFGFGLSILSKNKQPKELQSPYFSNTFFSVLSSNIGCTTLAANIFVSVGLAIWFLYKEFNPDNILNINPLY